MTTATATATAAAVAPAAGAGATAVAPAVGGATAAAALAAAAPVAASRSVHRPAWRRRLAAGCAALVLAVPSVAPPLVPPAMAQNNLPSLGDPSAEDLELGTEKKLGDRIMREIRADPDYLDDPLLIEYVEAIFQPLVAEARKRGNIPPELDQRLAWEPFLVRDKEVNAFALPGGYVGINLGLVAMTTTRDELASVLAHELSHITQRHIARSVASMKQASLVGLATMVLGILAASRGGNSNIDAAQAAMVGGQAIATQGMLNFSRDMEREADRTGFGLMQGAGFAPSGMASMFEKLDLASRLNDSGGFPYLRSHPLTAERIGEARSRLGAAPAAPPASVLEHALAEARAKVLMDVRVDALRRWQALDSDRITTQTTERAGNQYASALASVLLRDWQRADAAAAETLALVRGDARHDRRAERAVVLLQVQAQLARGDAARAESLVLPYAGDASRPVALFEGQIALASSGPGADARLKLRASDLQTWVAVHPGDAAAWLLLSQVWGRLGQPLREIRADAESHIALGDLQGGIDRLRAGQARSSAGGAGDFIDASVIDSRLRAVEAERRQIVADERHSRF